MMEEKLTIKDLDLKNKKALLRVDFNVPIENGIITDDSRIRASIPSIQYILEQGGSVILMSHLGRPNGEIDPSLSLRPCAQHLSKLLSLPVKMAPDSCGPVVQKLADDLKPGEILLLENLRFHKGEEKPAEEPTFVSGLADLGDLYINDAFGTAHRAHASTTVLATFFPGKSAMGFLMEQELAYLGSKLLHPKRPFYAILGGAKISTKFKVIEALMQKADVLLIGGAMAFSFFKAQGISTGKSKVENDFLPVARELLDVGSQSRCRVVLPVDIVITDKIEHGAKGHPVRINQGIPNGMEGVDIGPETIRKYTEELKNASTIFWNGPLGVFECPPFDHGTNAIAKFIAELTPKATTIVGGGDTIAAVEHAKVANKFSHVSTGGGASLEFIEFGRLPGIDALSAKTPSIQKK
jgi:3-phosphoglycerate kinase